jgi:hypothetical protein
MMVNYSDYFAAHGFKEKFYDAITKQFNAGAIIEKMKQVQDKWKSKFPHLSFKFENLKYDSLLAFNLSFTNELQLLNMEIK